MQRGETLERYVKIRTSINLATIEFVNMEHLEQ